MEIQNSNPTILSAADLPSRRPRGADSEDPKKNEKKKNRNQNPLSALYDGAIFATVESGLAPDPFSKYIEESVSAGSGSNDGDDDDESEGDTLEEPIDEQEIFGTLFSFLYFPSAYQNTKTQKLTE